MRDELLQLLACPSCGGVLQSQMSAHEPASIRSPNALRCSRCAKVFPIVSGIPRLVDDGTRNSVADKATSESFAHEFTQLDPTVSPVRKQREDVITFFRATGLDETLYCRLKNAPKRVDLTPEDLGYEPDGSALAGKLILDAGCGAGRFAKVAASYGARVVAMDVSAAVERAMATCAGYGVDVIQGDVLKPPLREASFDLVFSIGVLHHGRYARGSARARQGRSTRRNSGRLGVRARLLGRTYTKRRDEIAAHVALAAARIRARDGLPQNPPADRAIPDAASQASRREARVRAALHLEHPQVRRQRGHANDDLRLLVISGDPHTSERGALRLVL